MRLRDPAAGQRLTHRWKLRLMGMVLGERAPDVLQLLHYRPEHFGRPFSAWTHEALCGSTGRWSRGERELMAAFVSTLNHCLF
ncbi:MAG: hypothetical protein H6744_13520 [Deltaproteobacteria bacterium]|nr:hypothetical protein [Deltaproteobacteria bacterium]